MISFADLPTQARLSSLVLVLSILTACGGGGTAEPPTQNPSPPPTEEPGDDEEDGNDEDEEAPPEDRWVTATEYTDGSLPPIGSHRVTDSLRGKIYVLDSDLERLDIVDLVSGERESHFQFDSEPVHLTMGVGGDALYVALDDPASGGEDSVVTIDLERKAYDPEAVFSLSFSPWQIVATHDNRILVSGAISYEGRLALYDPASGELLDEAETSQELVFERDPRGNGVWGASNPFGEIFFIQPTPTQIGEVEERPGGGAWEEKIWTTADGGYLIVGSGGRLYQTEPFLSAGYEGWLSREEVDLIGVATDPEQDVITVYNDDSATTYNALTMQPVAEQEFDGKAIGGAYFQGKLYHQITIDDHTMQTLESAHPCAECGRNSEPEAEFTFSDQSVVTDTELTLYASESWDEEDPNDLQYRWDLDGDGRWDTEFSSNPTVTHEYYTSGPYEVRLQVKDTLGGVDIQTKELEVPQNSRPVTVLTQEPSETLEFRAGASAYDAATGTIYLSEEEGRRLYWVDLEEEVATYSIEFGAPIIQLWRSPSSDHLYVLFGDDDYSFGEGDFRILGAYPGSYLATVDMDNLEHTVTWELPRSVHDFVVNKNGNVIFTSGLFQAGSETLYIYKPGEGYSGYGSYGTQGSIYISLAYDPQGQAVYAFSGGRQNWSSIPEPVAVSYENMEGTLNISTELDPVEGRPVSGNAWVSPDGSVLITRGGVVLSTEDFSLRATILGDDFSDDLIGEVQFSADASFAVITLESGRVMRASGDSYENVEIVEGIDDAYRAYPLGNEIRVLSRTEAATQISQ